MKPNSDFLFLLVKKYRKMYFQTKIEMIKIKYQVKLINKFPFYKLKIKRKNNGTFG